MGFSTAIGPAQSPVAASGVPGAESSADSESPLPPDPAPQPPAPGDGEPGDGGDDPGGDSQPAQEVGGEPGDDGQPGDGNEEPAEDEAESAPALVLRVDSDPEAEGDQTRVEEGRAALFAVSAAFAENRPGLEEDVVVTVSVGGQGGVGQAEVEDFNAVEDFTVTIPAGQTVGWAEFTLEAIDDLVVEGEETVDVTGTADSYGITDITGALVTIVDNDSDQPPTPPPAPPADLIVSGQADPAVAVNLSVDAQAASGEQAYVEEGEQRTVTVKAALPDGESALAEAATFTVAIAADTAENSDFTAPASASVTIAAGQTSGTATFTFQAVADTILEGPETVSLTSTLAGYSVSPASLTIKDEDAAFTVTANPTAVGESAGATSIGLTVSFPNAVTSELAEQTQISFSAAGDGAAAGTDFAAISDFTVALAASAVTASTTATITPVDDVIDETSPESVNFTGSLFGRTASAAVAITDDDAAPAVINLAADVSAASGVQTVLAENAGATSVIVSAEFASGTAVETDTVLNLRMSQPVSTDFSLTIPKNQVRGTASVSVTPADNNRAGEATQTVTVSLRGTSSYTVNQAQFTIEDDEEAVVNLRAYACNPASAVVSEGDSRNACWLLSAYLPGDTVAADTVTVRELNFTAGTADYGSDDDFNVIYPGSLQGIQDYVRIPANSGESNRNALFHIAVVDDSVRDEGVETIVIGGKTDQGFTVRTASINLYDNDNSPNRINLVVDGSDTLLGFQPSVPEGSANQRVKVTAVYADRTARSSATAVTVSVAGAGGAHGAEAADFTAVNDFTVTIPANQISGDATFDLTTVDDDLLEGPEDMSLSGSATGFTVNGTKLIIDDNETTPTVDLSVDAQPAAGEQSYVDEGSTRTVTVTAAVPVGAAALTSAATFTVAIAADTAEAGDFTVPATVDVTIAANARSGTAVVSFQAAADTVLEGPETVSFTSSLAGYDVNPASLTIRDQNSRFRLGISSTAVAENAAPVSLTLSVEFPNAQSSELTEETQFAVTVTGDGAVAGTDFANIPNFTIPVAAGSLRGNKAVTFAPTDDAIRETAAERAKFTVSWFGQAASVFVAITDNDPAPTAINIYVDTSSDPGLQTSLAEDGGVQTVTVIAEFASGALDSDTVLRMDISGGTAQPTVTVPRDFFFRGGIDNDLIIPKNQTRGTTTFRMEPVNNDWTDLSERTLHVGLRGTSYTVNRAVLTIQDDEPAVINLSVRAVKCQPSDSTPNSPDRMGEGDGTVCFEVSGALPSGVVAGADVTVSDLTFTGGTAVAGTDFTAAFPDAGRKNISIGRGHGGQVVPARVNITALDDSVMDEGFETIVIHGRAAGYAVRSIAVNLGDNDNSPNLIILKVDADAAINGCQPSLGEGVSGQSVTVFASYANPDLRLLGPAVITMSVAAAGGARQAEANDFTAVPSFTITIPRGQASASGTFTLTTADDQRVEGAEDLAITGTATRFVVAGSVVTIDDDDAPPAIALRVDADRAVDGTQTSIGEASAAVTAQVTAEVPDGKTFESDVAITVSVDGNGGTGEAEAADFAAVNDFTVTIPAGQSSGSATFTLDPVEDDYAEGAETVAVSGVATTAGVRITGASLQIDDNDVAPTTASLTVDLDGGTTGLQTAIGEGDAAATATVAVRLPDGSKTFESDTAVTVTIAGEATAGKAEAADFTTGLANNRLLLTIPAGGRAASGTFTLTIVDDQVVDVTPETITLSGSADRSGLAITGTAVTIDSDNDSRPAALSLAVDTDTSTPAVQTSVAEGASRTVQVTASLPSGSATLETDTEVTVTLSTDGAATAEANDFSTTGLTNGNLTVTIPGGSRSGSATFTLAAADDNVGGEGAETVFLSGSAAGFTSASTSFTITDGDRISVSVEGNLISSTERRVLTAAEGSGPYTGAHVRVRVMPPPEPTSPQLTFEEDAVFTVRITADGSATAEADDFSTDQPGDSLQITILAGQVESSGTFTLSVTDDDWYDGEETIALVGSTALPGVGMAHSMSAFITITDNETAPVITLAVDTDLVVLGEQDYIPEATSNRKVKVTASIPSASTERESDTVINVSAASTVIRSAVSPSDYSFSAWGDDGSMQLTLPRGSNQVAGYFSLSTFSDAYTEGSETFSIIGQAAGFTTNGLSDIVPAVVTIDDSDNPSVIYLRVDLDSDENGAQKTAAEGTTVTANVAVSLPTGASPLSTARPVRVSLIGAGGTAWAETTDFAAVTPFDVTISSGDDTGTGSFRLQLLDDAVADVLPELIEVSGSSSGWTVRNDFIGIDQDNDSFPEVSLSVNPLSSAEGADPEVTVTGALTGTATLEENIPVTVSVDGSVGSGMASSDDFDAVTDFTLTVGQTSRTGSASFNLTGTDDNVAGEGAEKLLISGSVPYTGVTVTVNGVEMTITDGDSSPTVINLSVDADDETTGVQSSVTEGAAAATVRVTASFPEGAAVLASKTTVRVSVSGDGGTGQGEAADFTAVTAFDLEIPAGADRGSATFSLSTVQDDYAEGSETLTVSGTASGFTVNNGSVTIDDDDALASFALSVDADTGVNGTQTGLGEGSAAKTAQVTASLPNGSKTFESDTVITVSVDGNGGAGEAEAADFAPVTDFSLTVAAGATSGTATFTFDPTEDDYAEGTEKITVSGTTARAGVGVASAELEIADNDAAPAAAVLTVDLDADNSGDQDTIGEGDAAVTATVKAALPSGSKTFESDTAITVTVTGEGTTGKAESSDFSTDQANNSFKVTISAGQTSGSGTFTLTIADDNVADVVSETITVSGTADRAGLSVTGDAITIDSDNDTGPATISLGVDASSDTGVQTAVVEQSAAHPLTVSASFPNGSNVYETDTVITLSATGVTAAAADFSLASTSSGVSVLKLAIPAGQTTVSDSTSFQLTATDDNIAEQAETLTIGGSATGFTVSGVTMTINDDDSAPTAINLSLDVDSETVGEQTEVTEGDAATTVTVKASLAGSVVLTTATVVKVTVAGTSASAADFTAVPSFNITIPAGAASATGTFTLTVADDNIVESSESLTVSGTTAAAGFTAVNGTALSIADNDAAPTSIILTLNPASVGEDDGATSIDVTASFPAGSPVLTTATVATVSVAGSTATSGTDFGAVSSFNVSIAAGATSGMGTFTFTPTSDTVAGEGTETVTVSGAAAGFSFTNAALSIADNDAKPSNIILTVDTDGETTGDQSEVAEDAGSVTVTVTAALPAGSPTLATATEVTVKLVGEAPREGAVDERDVVLGLAKGKTAHATGYDYSSNKTNDTFTITIPAGSLSQSGDFTLTVEDDSLQEGSETFEVTGSATGFMFNSSPKVTITDNETSNISLFFSDNRGERYPFSYADLLQEGIHTRTDVPYWPGGVPEVPFTIQVMTTKAVGETYRDVNVVASGAAKGGVDTDTSRDYTLYWAEYTPNGRFRIQRGAKVSLYGGDTQVPTQAIRIYDDNIAEGDETIILTGRSSAGSSNSLTFTIKDNDVAPTVINLAVDTNVSTSDVSETSLMEGDSATTVEVTASFPANSAVLPHPTTVAVSVADNTATSRDHLAVPSFNVVIPALESSGSARFTFTLVDDAIVEGSETLDITGAVSGFTVNAAMITIKDNETITLSVDTDGTEDGDQTAVDEGATDQTVTVTAAFDADQTVLTGATAVTASVAGGGTDPASASDYTEVNDFTITIPAGSLSATATFDLTAAADNIAGEGTETLSVSGALTGYTINGAAISINDLTAAPNQLVFTLDADTGTSGNQTSIGEGIANRTVQVSAAFPVGSTVWESDLSIPATVGAGTAESTDYSVTGGTFNLTIPGGGTSSNAKTFTLTTVDDNVAGETDALSVGSSLAGYTVTPASLTITDADSKPTQITLSAATTHQTADDSVEEGTSDTVTVTAAFAGSIVLETALSAPVVVAQGTSEGAADYTASTASFNISIPANGSSGSANFTLAAVDDNVAGETDAVAVNGGTLAGYTITGTTVKLIDKDVAPTNIALKLDADTEAEGTQTSVGEGTSNRTVRVWAEWVNTSLQLEKKLTIPVTVAAGTAETGDYSVTGGSFNVVLPGASQTASTHSFTLTVNDDDVAGETDALSVGGTLAGYTIAAASLTLGDSDAKPTGIALSIVTDHQTADDSVDEGTSGTVTVTASFPSDGSVLETALAVPVVIADGTTDGSSDYAASPSSFNVSIPANSRSGNKNFTLNAKDDDVADGTEEVTVKGGTLAGYLITSDKVKILDGDTAPSVINLTIDADPGTDGAQTSVGEGVSNRSVSVWASFPNGSAVLESDLTVPVVVAAGTAESADYSVGDGSFDVTIGAGTRLSATAASFTLTTADDDLSGESDVLSIKGGTLAGYTINPASLTISDADAAPTVITLTIDADANTNGNQTSVDEGVSGRGVRVWASFPAGSVPREADVKVPVTVAAGTAESGDYSVDDAALEVTIGAGTLTSATPDSFSLQVRNDNVAGESDALAVKGGTLAGFTIRTAQLSLGDADTLPSQIALSTNPTSVAEDGAARSVSVWAELPSTGPVLESSLSVPVVVAGGTAESGDYAVDDATFNVTIGAGTHKSATAGTFNLTVNDDNVAGEKDKIKVGGGTLSGYTITAAEVSLGDADALPSQITLSVDADPGTNGVQTSVGEGVSGRSVSVWAELPATGPVLETALSVPVAVAAGTAEASDYSITGNTFNVTIGAGTHKSASAGTFSLTVNDDSVAGESDVLSIGGGSLAGYTITAANLTLGDSDTAPTAITLSASPGSVDEGTANQSVSVSAAWQGSVVRESAVTVPVTVAAGTAESSDYSIVDNTFDVTISAGAASGSGSFSLTVNDDNVAGEADRLSVTGSKAGFSITSAGVTLGDSDAKPSQITLSVDADSGTDGVQTSVGEGVSGRSVSVWAELPSAGPVLETALSVPVAVAAGTAESSDYSITGNTFNVTIGAGTHKSATAGTFSLTVNNDNVAVESDVLSVGGGSLAGYNITAANLTLGDSDTAPTAITLSASPGSVAEGAANRSVSVTAAWQGSVVRESAVTVPVTVAAGTAESSDYSIVDNTFDVTISGEAASGSGSFSLTVNNDNVAGESDRLSVTGSKAGFSITSTGVTLGDADTLPSQITLSVDADPDTGGAQTSVGEGVSGRSVSVWAELPSAGPVLESSLSVPVVVSAGTAEASDYSIVGNTFNVTIGAGTHKSATAGTFSLTVNDDDVSGESDVLSVGGGALAGYTITAASLTLGDSDDAPTEVTLTLDADPDTGGAQTSVGEGVSGRSVSVWAAFPAGSTPREADVKVPVVVAAGTAEGSDYSIVDNTFEVTIGAGTLQSATAGTFSLTVNDDIVAGESDVLSVGGGALVGYTITAADLTLGDSDTAPTAITLSANPGSVDEGTANRSVSVTAAWQGSVVRESAVTVPVTVAAGTAESSDYSIVDNTFDVTISGEAASGSGSFSLTVNNDNVAGESDRLSVTGAKAGFSITSVGVTLGDADTLPSQITLSVDADPGTSGVQTSVGEGVSGRSVSVWAELPSAGPVLETSLSVPVAVSAGTAEASDYAIVDNTFNVTIGAGTHKSATAGAFSLTVNNDNVGGESDVLSVGGGVLAGYTITSASLTLDDSDTAPTAITLSASPGNVAEGTANQSVSVTAAWQGSVVLESAVTVPVTVAAGTAEASDYSIADNTFDVTISAGAASGSGSFSLTVNNDNVAGESDRLSVTGSKAGFSITSAGVTLGDSDAKPSQITLSVDADPGTNGAQSSVGEGVSGRSVSVWAELPSAGSVLETALSVPVVVAAGTAETGDYVIVDNTFNVTIGAGTHKSASAGTFSLTVNNDDVAGETDVLSVGGGTLAGYSFTAASLTLDDSDTAPTAITLSASPGSVDEGTANQSVSVTASWQGSVVRESAVTVPVTVAAGTAEASDYTIADNTFDVTISGGAASGSGSFSLTVNNDDVAGESDRLSVTGSKQGFTIASTGVTLDDADAKPTSIKILVDADPDTDGAQTSIGEGVSGRSVSVWAVFPSTGPVLESDVTVDVSVAAGTAQSADYSTSGTSGLQVTIGAGDHRATAASFTLNTVDDSIAGESNEAITVSGSVSGDSSYTFTAAALSITDGDSPPSRIILTVDTDPGTAGSQTKIAEGISNRTVTVTAAFPAGSPTLLTDLRTPVVVEADTAEASDFSVSGGSFTITIASGASSATGTFTLTAADDDLSGESDAIAVKGGVLAGYTIVPASISITDADAAPTEITLTVDVDGSTDGLQTKITEQGPPQTVSVWAAFPDGSTPLESSVSVAVSVEDGTAESDDYVVTGGSFNVTIEGGTSKSATPGTFTLDANEDTVFGETDAVLVDGTLAGFTVTDAEITITDSASQVLLRTVGEIVPTAIKLTVDTHPGENGAQTSVGEGVSARSVSVWAEFTNGGAGSVFENDQTVAVTVAAGTAEGSDYSITDNTFNVVIGGGTRKSATPGTFLLTVADDNVAGETDALLVGGTLTDFTVAGAQVTLGDSDVKPSSVALTVSPTSAAEDGTARTVSVWAELPSGGPVLESALTAPVVVAKGTAEASDYTVDDADFNVTIGAGRHKSAAAGSFTLTVRNDDVGGEDDKLQIKGGALSGFTITPAALTLGDADSAPTEIVLSANPTSVNEGATDETVSVSAAWKGSITRESALTIPVTVSAGTAESSDYDIDDNTFDATIDGGAASGSGSFTITVRDDQVSGESDKVRITGAKAGFTVAATGLTLGDADTAPVAIALEVDADPDQAGRQSDVPEGTTGRAVKVWAAFPDNSVPREQSVTVNVAIGDGTTDGAADYSTTGTSGLQVTIGAGTRESATPALFTLTTRDDDISQETGEAITVGGSVAGDSPNPVFSVTAASLGITDGDTPPNRILLTVDADGGSEGNQNAVEEGVSNRQVTVTAAFPDGSPTLPANLDVPVVVAAGTAESSDYSVNRANFTILIAAGASSGTGVFTLTVADDNVAGESDAIEIKGGTLAGYTIEKASLSLTDADAVPTKINLSLDNTEVDEGETEEVTVTAAFPVGSAVLETKVRVTVTVTPDGSTEQSDYEVSPSGFSIDIPAGSLSYQGSFNLTAEDDDVAGENDKVKVTGTADGFTFNDPVTVNIEDTDPKPAGILLAVDKNNVDEGETEEVKVTAAFDGSKWDDNTMVTITVGDENAEDYTADDSSFTVTINRATQNVSRTFRLTANEDNDQENEQIFITGMETLETFTVARAEITINDNDSSATPPRVEDPTVDPPPPPTDPPPPPPPPPPTGPPALPAAPAQSLSSDASLRSLRVSPGTLSPGFAPATLGYTVAVSANVWTLQVAAVPNHAAARAAIDGTTLSGAHSVFLGSDRKTIDVVVTAEDGTTVRTYRLTITRGTGPGFADSLSTLTACTGAALRPFGFEDVAGWFSENDINCIGYYGITLGRSATRFAPSEVVSRWQMALFLFRAAGPAGVTLPAAEDQGFTDIKGLSEEAMRAANMMAQLGVMPGSGGKFNPQGKISRAAMALMLDSFLGLVTVGEGGVARDSVQPDEVLFADIGGLSEANQLAIRRIFEMGVTRGTSTTEFRPGNSVTRGQMAQFIARALTHTIARPVGVSIQTDPSTREGGRVDVVVSVRDEDFRPVTGARVDMFTARDRNAAFTDDGVCIAAQVAKVGGSRACAIDGSDRATGPTGDIRVKTARTVGTTIWAWRAAAGAQLNDSRPAAQLTFR